jgi:uncharacterized protein with gpF-like domain
MADQLPFQEAIDFLRNKVNLPTRRWDDVLRQGQVRGFTVAGIARDDMLSDFMAALLVARTAGTGFNEFRKSFDEIVDRTGWKFNAKGSTDEERRDWRAGIIYNTNMRTSYMAGRWKQLTDPDVLKYRPYLQYVHSRALHPRLLHLHWNGLVLAATDPAWRYMYPPNGWGCAGLFRTFRESIIADKGIEAADAVIPDWKINTITEAAQQIRDPVPAGPFTTYTEKEDAMDAAQIAALEARERKLAEEQASFAEKVRKDEETARAARAADDAVFVNGIVSAGRLPIGLQPLAAATCGRPNYRTRSGSARSRWALAATMS